MIIKNKDLLYLIIFTFFLIIIMMELLGIGTNKEGFKEGYFWDDIGDALKKLINEIEEKMHEFRDMVNELPNTVKNSVMGPLNEVGNKMNDFGTKFTGEFNKQTSTATAESGKAINSIGDAFKRITGLFNNIINRLKNIGDGFKEIFNGIGEEFEGIGNGLRLGFTDIGTLFEYTGEYIITHVLCFMKFIAYLPFCIFFYTIDIFFKILYLPIRIILFLLSLAIIKDIYLIEAYVFKQINGYNNLIKKYTGINLLRWPLLIREQCYNCKRLKTNVLKNKADTINQDFENKIPSLLQKGVNTIIGGGNKIATNFSSPLEI